jgi:hypothetical protein
MTIRRTVRKCIKPHSALINGRMRVVTAINVRSYDDDLFGYVVFKYTLYDEAGSWAGDGKEELVGEAYQAWDSTPEHAFTIVADLIGVTFEPVVGEGRGFFDLEIE